MRVAGLPASPGAAPTCPRRSAGCRPSGFVSPRSGLGGPVSPQPLKTDIALRSPPAGPPAAIRAGDGAGDGDGDPPISVARWHWEGSQALFTAQEPGALHSEHNAASGNKGVAELRAEGEGQALRSGPPPSPPRPGHPSRTAPPARDPRAASPRPPGRPRPVGGAAGPRSPDPAPEQRNAGTPRAERGRRAEAPPKGAGHPPPRAGPHGRSGEGRARAPAKVTLRPLQAGLAPAPK